MRRAPHILRRTGFLIAVAVIGIEPDAVAELAAEHAIERLASSLRRYLPQRHLEPGQGNEKGAGLGAGEHIVAPDLVPAIFDVAWILTAKLRLQFRDQPDDRGRARIGARRAVTGDAGVQLPRRRPSRC